MVQQQDLVTLTVDGREVAVPKGTTVLQAAAQLGIEIPTFCYSKKMDPLGACRMCLVSIEKAKGFPPACATPVAPGMVVRTDTPDVVKTQQGMLEFLLINHPLDCPICDKGGECPLQNLTFKYGPGKSRYAEEKRHFVKHLPIGPQVVLDRERCIVCQLCVRFMDDVADDPQIVLLSRGGKTEINVFPDRPFDSPFAGNTIELCPVGALTSRKYRFRARPWDLTHTPSVCPTCAVGCNIRVDTRRGELLRLMARENTAVDDGWLCDYGRFATIDRALDGARITSPMVRRNGVLEETSWDDALETAARGLERARGGVAALAGAQTPNEELYLLGRILRTHLRSPHVAVPGASPAPTSVIGGASIADMETADAIVLIGADPIAHQHVLDLRLKKQVKRREIPLVILANEPTGLDYLATAKVGFDPADVMGTVRRLRELIQQPEPAAPDANGSAGLLSSVTEAISSAASDLASSAVHAAAALFGSNTASTVIPDEQLAPAAAALRTSTRGLVVVDERLLAGEQLTNLAAGLRDLAGALGSATGATRQPLALAAAANSRGAAEMGAHGGWLAGGAALDDGQAGSALGTAWGSQPVTARGKNASEILDAARAGDFQALYILDHDPLADGIPGALQALEKVPFVVVQASRSGPTLELADVVFPTANFGETIGTLTNLEGCVQRLGRAMALPDDVHDGWQILADLGQQLGGKYPYLSGEDVTQEIARVTKLESWRHLLIQAVQPAMVGGVR